jgi:hypothetical protein
MAKGDPKKKKGIKAKDKFTYTKGTSPKKGTKETYKSTTAKKKVAPTKTKEGPVKTKVTIGKPKKAIKYTTTRKIGDRVISTKKRIATPAQAKKFKSFKKKVTK